MSLTLFESDDDLFQIDLAAEAAGGVVADPFPIWADLLAQAPVHKGTLAECMGLPPERNGGGLYRPDVTYYSVFSFAAVSDVLTRRDDFWSEAYVDMGLPHQFGDTILNMDGLRHRRYRDLIQEIFQPANAAEWWRTKVIDKLVDELIGRFEKDGSVDLNAQFFARLPLNTVTAAFGMSFEEGLMFRRHMLRSLHSTTLEDMVSYRSKAGLILDDVIRDRQAKPQDDVISRLAHAELKEDDGSCRKLTAEEIASFCRLIVEAGGETTWMQLGLGLFALLNHRDQLADVISDRTLLPNTILETVRWHADPLSIPRKVMKDTVLHGVELPKGAHLHVCLGAANRDPARWDNPAAYDLHRPFQRSVAFAAGAHSCLGQHVARQELEAAFSALFDRFPNIRWDPSKPAAKLSGSLLQRGPGPLHVLLH